MKKKLLTMLAAVLIACSTSAGVGAWAETPTPVADETVLFEQNFDVEDMTYDVFTDKMKTDKNQKWTFWYENYAANYQTGDDNNATIDTFWKEQTGDQNYNSFEIKDGRLVMRKKTGYQKATNFAEVTVPQQKTGKISIQFELQMESSSGYHTYFVYFLSGTNAYLARNEKMVNLRWVKEGGGNSPASENALGSNTYFQPEKNVKIEVIVDLDNKKSWAYCDGVLTTGQAYTGQNDVRRLRFAVGDASGTADNIYYIDNIKVSKLTEPTLVSANITDGQNGAEISAPQLNFNIPLDESAIDNIKLYESDTELENASCVLSEEGRTVTFNDKLKYSTPYKVVVGDGAQAKNKLSLPAQSISFHTMHEPSEVTNSLVFKNAETDTEISSLEGVNKVKMLANLMNTSLENEKTVTLIFARYRGSVMEDIAYKKASIAADASVEISMEMDVPADKDGLSLRAFVWDSYKTMRRLAVSEKLPVS